MSSYGRENCDHVWRYRKNSWYEGCTPAICIECGAFGCICDIKGGVSIEIFFKEGQDSDANINGKWKNPYVK